MRRCFLQKTKTDRPRLWRNSVGGPFFMKKAQLKWKVGKNVGTEGRLERGREGNNKKVLTARKRTAHININAATGRRFFFIRIFCVNFLRGIYKRGKL